MVPTFTCGFLRSNTPFAIWGLQNQFELTGGWRSHRLCRESNYRNRDIRHGAGIRQLSLVRCPLFAARLQRTTDHGQLTHLCRVPNVEVPPKLPQGLEPWTSTLPRWRSTAELWQRPLTKFFDTRPTRRRVAGSARSIGTSG